MGSGKEAGQKRNILRHKTAKGIKEGQVKGKQATKSQACRRLDYRQDFVIFIIDCRRNGNDSTACWYEARGGACYAVV